MFEFHVKTIYDLVFIFILYSFLSNKFLKNETNFLIFEVFFIDIQLKTPT